MSFVDEIHGVSFDSLPFFFCARDEPGNAGLPESLPLEIRLNEKLRMFQHAEAPALTELLRKEYKKGSMLNGSMIPGTFGEAYAKASLQFVKDCVHDVRGLNILEIGCGNGRVIRELSQQGAQAVGLEPGNQIQLVEPTDSLQVLQGFFPHADLENREFELIMSFNVLEHMQEPVVSLLRQAQALAEDGEIIVAVPNCEPSLNLGDISIFLHEHCNYFSFEALTNTAMAAGLHVKKRWSDEKGAMLFVLLSKRQPKRALEDPPVFDPAIFVRNSQILSKAVVDFITQSTSQEDAAVYCPMRAMNILWDAKLPHVRLIDDHPDMVGKYFPGFSRKVENFASLQQNPPRVLLIYSFTYGQAIAQKCQVLGKEVSVSTIQQLASSLSLGSAFNSKNK
jgi:2-polyprenyl-3-methyl-5-hydroxy-6-metoxy-1,4-benzoquinol methylase